jgi:hypothetical protein
MAAREVFLFLKQQQFWRAVLVAMILPASREV